jgi:hypothetical protein
VRDQLNRNTLAVTGTPTLVPGALTIDTNEALAFAGPTSFASAADSTSLSITGSMSIEFFLKLASLPGSTLEVVQKTGSYLVQVDSSGRVLFRLANGASNVTVLSNTSLSTNTWYHIVCVYNGNFAGTPRFGEPVQGTTSAQVEDDNTNNKAVGKFTLLETGLLKNVNVLLQYIDEIWPVQMRAVVYSDLAGEPDALVTSSPVQVLNPPTPAWRVWTWVNLPLTPALVPAGVYHIGYIADTIAGISKSPLVVSRDPTGGVASRRPDSVTSPSDPFDAVSVSNTDNLSIYCDYTPVGRTGNEGKALIYINGARNTTATYSAGIADSANALQVCPLLTAQVDELSIWNKALSSVQVATHYTAH